LAKTKVEARISERRGNQSSKKEDWVNTQTRGPEEKHRKRHIDEVGNGLKSTRPNA